MPKRKPPEQLDLLGARPANDDAGLDAFLGDAKIVTEATPECCPDRVRELAGRKAKRRGDALEAWLRTQLEAAEFAGHLASWEQFPTPTKYEPRRCACGRLRMELVYCAKASVDFLACSTDGRSIAIECKTVEGARLPRAAILTQQERKLTRVAEAGGISLLVVEFRDEGVVTAVGRQYVIPWRQVPWQVARTAMSLPEAVCARWRVRHGEVIERVQGR